MYPGVDLGGTTIASAVAEDGKIVVEKSIPTQSNEGPQAVITRIARLVQELAAQTGATLSALGMGVPGLVDRERGRTRFLPNLPTQWRDVPVAELLARDLGCPVFLLNDARLATLGELAFGQVVSEMCVDGATASDCISCDLAATWKHAI